MLSLQSLGIVGGAVVIGLLLGSICFTLGYAFMSLTWDMKWWLRTTLERRRR